MKSIFRLNFLVITCSWLLSTSSLISAKSARELKQRFDAERMASLAYSEVGLSALVTFQAIPNYTVAETVSEIEALLWFQDRIDEGQDVGSKWMSMELIRGAQAAVIHKIQRVEGFDPRNNSVSATASAADREALAALLARCAPNEERWANHILAMENGDVIDYLTRNGMDSDALLDGTAFVDAPRSLMKEEQEAESALFPWESSRFVDNDTRAFLMLGQIQQSRDLQLVAGVYKDEGLLPSTRKEFKIALEDRLPSPLPRHVNTGRRGDSSDIIESFVGQTMLGENYPTTMTLLTYPLAASHPDINDIPDIDEFLKADWPVAASSSWSSFVAGKVIRKKSQKRTVLRNEN